VSGLDTLAIGAGKSRSRVNVPRSRALKWGRCSSATPPISDTLQAAYLSGLRAAGEVRRHLAGARQSTG